MAILSHRYKFIFLKSRKTAGSSIEIALGPLCGPEDVLHPTRDGRAFGLRERNNRKARADRAVSDYLGVAWGLRRRPRQLQWKRIRKHAERILPDSHTTAAEARQAVAPEHWNGYYKFCFERNPFDRLVSFYHWRTSKLEEKPAFREFALAAISDDGARQKRYRAARFPNRPFYLIDGELALERVCRFENLERELGEVAELLGIPWDGTLPNAKGSYRKERTYREYYDAELKRACERAFETELALFGFSF